MTKFELGWVCGIFEGEGYFGLHKSRGHFYPHAEVGSTDLDVLERFHRLVGVGTLSGPFMRGSNKPIYKWSLNRQEDVHMFVELVSQHLSTRRAEQIDASYRKAT